MADILDAAGHAAEITTSSPQVEILTPSPHRVERETVIIHKRRGFLWPITGAIGLVIIGFAGIAAYNLMGESQRTYWEFIGKPVHPMQAAWRCCRRSDHGAWCRTMKSSSSCGEGRRDRNG